MPQIPGVPTIEPVQKPYMSPKQAGRPGESIEGLGEESQGLADESLQIQGHIRQAQQHVDTLAARNQLDQAYTNLQGELAKTQNSRDVEGVIQNGRDTLNQISKKWSNSPAAVAIQMDADSLNPGMQHLGQVRKIDLMGKEFKISLAHQGEIFAKDYASARAVGDKGAEQSALNGFTDAVGGGVKTGLIGDVEAGEAVRKFREQGQELQIRNAISNPNPEVNQKIYDQMNSTPEMFPDVNSEQLDALKIHAQNAVKSHIEYMDWAQEKLAEKTLLPKAITKWRNPATGQVDEDKALADTAGQFERGEISLKQNEAVARGIKVVASEQGAAIKSQMIKADNDIEKLISENKFGQAMGVADSMRTTTENAGLGWYAAAGKRIDGARRQKEAEYRADAHFDAWENKQKEERTSQANSVDLLQGVANGSVNEQNLIDALGKKQITYKNYLQLSHVANRVQNEPDTKKALDVLYSSIPPPPKTASAEDKLEYENMKWNLYQEWEKGVGEKQLKGDDKTKYAAEIVKPFVSKEVSDRLDKITGVKSQTSAPAPEGHLLKDLGESISGFLTGQFGNKPPEEIRVRQKSTGKTGTIPSNEFDEKLYEKVQ